MSACKGHPFLHIAINNPVLETGLCFFATSQITSLTFNNNAVTSYTYDPQDQRLTDIVTTKSVVPLLNVHYTFDNVGNILSAQDNIGTAGTTNYVYDDLNRLLSATVTNGANQYARSWTYTPIGNMQTRVEQGATTTYAANFNNRTASPNGNFSISNPPAGTTHSTGQRGARSGNVP